MRRILRFSLLILLALLVLIPAGGYFYLQLSLPQTSGSVTLAGLDKAVQITRDSDGVPHIFASSDNDALFALGYVHAQDRLWQMEMNRRIGNGRLSEVLGEATLDVDKFQRSMGYARLVRTGYEQLTKRSKRLLDAYVSGVNAWLNEGHTLPPEFLVLGVTPEPWTPYDSLVWAKMMSWDLGGDYDLELLRAKLLAALGPERAAQIMPDYPVDGVNILNNYIAPSEDEEANMPNSTTADASTEHTLTNSDRIALYQQLPAALFSLHDQLELNFSHGGREVGSNNWVIAGSRTESGKPLLADDPHLGSSIPSIWYLAEIKGSTLHVSGATLPGLPNVVIGHNQQIAWGVTNLNPDVQDLFLERINPENPNQYDVNGIWTDFEIYTEEIKVSGQEEPIQWAARWTRHGPLISDVSETSMPVSLRWTALDEGDTTMDTYIGINYASNWQEFLQAMRYYIAPSQNFVYADVEGNIGYFAPGRIPIRKNGSGLYPAPGWNDNFAWTDWIPFEQLPQAYNPDIGYIATANNRVVNSDYPYHLSNDWAEPYRAERIVELIEQMSSNGETLSLDDVAAIQADQSSNEVRQTLPLLLKTIVQEERQKQALAILEQWNGDSSLDSVAASIYEAWLIHLTRAIFEDDLRGELYKEMSNRANPIFLYNVLNNPAISAVWCDNVLSAPVESCDETLRQSLDKALDDLSERLGNNMDNWQWEKLHLTHYPHRPFSEVPLLRWFFHRSIANGGNRFTVNVAPVRWSEPFAQYTVPSYRQIIDLAAFNNSRYIITTGQSGNVLSQHYANLIERHRDVAYLSMIFGQEDMAGETLWLEPAQ